MFFMETIELIRKELYDKVWSTTLTKLTQQYVYTNDGIKKLCKQFEIPLLDSSYWSQLKFNKKLKKEKQNPIFGGVDKIVLTIREEGNPINQLFGVSGLRSSFFSQYQITILPPLTIYFKIILFNKIVFLYFKVII